MTAAPPSNAALVAFLAQFAGEEVLYCPNPGNAGDCLIAAGSFAAMRAAGLTWRRIDHRAPAAAAAGRVVLYAGGGNLVRYYGHAAGFIAAQHTEARRLVLLPHTVRGHEDLLAQLGDNVDLIARDRETEAHLAAAAPGARRHLMHDAAFGLVPEALALRRLARPNLVAAENRLRMLRRRLLMGPAPAGGPVLRAFRTDPESAGAALPPDNYDVSRIFSGAVWPEAFAVSVTARLFAILRRFAEVETDRLHVAIAGALLRMPVRFFDNSYGKNQAVFAHSMEGRFPTVAWCGRAPEARLTDTS